MRIDFYLLKEPALSGEALAVRLIEKAYLCHHRVLVHCETKHHAQHLDKLLWTYKDDSFIPHSLQAESLVSQTPILIVYDGNHHNFNDILFNMTPTIPAFHTQFQRMIEIVVDKEEAKEISRQHYRAYRALQYELHTHAITKVD